MQKKTCIIFSTADWKEPYWTNKQYTAQQLAQRGWSVLYVESIGLRAPKLGSAKDLGRIKNRLMSGIRAFISGPLQVEKNIWVLSPLVVPAAYRFPLLKRFNQSLMQWMIAHFLKKHGGHVSLVWSYHPFMMDVTKTLKPDHLVYHCVDDLSAVPGIHVEEFKKAEVTLLTKADYVFVTAPALLDHCKQYNANSYYYSNVVDIDHFKSGLLVDPDDLAEIPHPRLVYHGVLSDFKLDFELLLNTAKNNPTWSLMIIGEQREGQDNFFVRQMRELGNVYFLGYKRYQELPAYLNQCDVGLLPTSLNKYTDSMFPMKYYEYIASGLPVASTPLAFTRHVYGGVETGESSQEFSDAINRQIMHGRISSREIDTLVGDNTWSKRMDKMLSHISPRGNVK